MFERYTEKARRVIFFARYEASQFGSPYIETEHLLLGLLREDKALTNRFLRSHASVESIRKQIEGHTMIREKVSISVDLPLSNECKRVLAYAIEEAERLSHRHIGTEHLLLGLLREEKSFAAEILHERGLRLEAIREELARASQSASVKIRPATPVLAEFTKDLAADDQELGWLIGRESELFRVIQILCSRDKRNPLLVGELGIGKTVIVEGLAQRIAGGDVPSFLAAKRILKLDATHLRDQAKTPGGLEELTRTIIKELTEAQDFILFVDGFQTLVDLSAVDTLHHSAGIIAQALSDGIIQCIGTATPYEYRKSMESDPALVHCFRSVDIAPLQEAEAIRVLFSVKEKYEKFHAVSYTDGAIESAVFFSKRYISDRQLPAKAINVLDEAGARVKLRQTMMPDEITEVLKRIKFIVHRMENAIVNHEFEKARFYADEERKERENLRGLRERYHLDESSTGVVTREDVECVVAEWAGVPVDSMREEYPLTEELKEIQEETQEKNEN